MKPTALRVRTSNLTFSKSCLVIGSRREGCVSWAMAQSVSFQCIFLSASRWSSLKVESYLRLRQARDFAVLEIRVSLLALRRSASAWCISRLPVGCTGQIKNDGVTFHIVELVVGPLKESALAVDPDIDLLKELMSNNDIMSLSVT